MTKTPKHLLSKMQGILRKGTAGILCMILLTSLIATGCKKTPLPDEAENNPTKTEITLSGTSWKLVGIVDTRTGSLKVLEPNDCKECYRITFETDSTFSGQGVNNQILWGKYAIDYTTHSLRIITFAHTEMLDIGDEKLYRQILREIQSFILKNTNPRILHLYYDDGKSYLKYEEKGDKT